MVDEEKETRMGGARGADSPVQSPNPAGSEAIKWGAIVVIVLAILYFLARYVIPLF